MKFTEALERVINDDNMIRRTKWPDGVVCSVDKNKKLKFYHVAACELDLPDAIHFLENDWIVVEDYSRDISYKSF